MSSEHILWAMPNKQCLPYLGPGPAAVLPRAVVGLGQQGRSNWRPSPSGWSVVVDQEYQNRIPQKKKSTRTETLTIYDGRLQLRQGGFEQRTSSTPHNHRRCQERHTSQLDHFHHQARCRTIWLTSCYQLPGGLQLWKTTNRASLSCNVCCTLFMETLFKPNMYGTSCLWSLLCYDSVGKAYWLSMSYPHLCHYILSLLVFFPPSQIQG